MRHGHADGGSDDYARELAEAGRVAVQNAGRELAEQGVTVQYVLTSSAPRAIDTARLVAAALGYSGEIHSQRSLYLAQAGVLRDVLRNLPNAAESVLLVGHNPGLSALAQWLSKHQRGLSPAEYAIATRNIDSWQQL
jgi:phosphohistidine phosphatase